MCGHGRALRAPPEAIAQSIEGTTSGNCASQLFRLATYSRAAPRGTHSERERATAGLGRERGSAGAFAAARPGLCWSSEHGELVASQAWIGAQMGQCFSKGAEDKVGAREKPPPWMPLPPPCPAASPQLVGRPPPAGRGYLMPGLHVFTLLLAVPAAQREPGAALPPSAGAVRVQVREPSARRFGCQN